MKARRCAALLAVSGLALGACGGSSDQPVAGDTTAELIPPTDPPASADASDPQEPSEPPVTESPEDGAAADEPAQDLPATTTDDESAPTTPAPSDEAIPATTVPPEPDDGCSTDGSPTVLEVADGPRPDLPVAAESADSPFPELAVRQLNCAGGWVQLKNEIPAALPVLAWFWAPH